MSDEEYISGETHKARKVSNPNSSYKMPIPRLTLPVVGAAIVLCAAGFAAGVAYQKDRTKNSAAISSSGSSSTGFPGGGRGGFGRRAGGIGQVTTISATSITINNQRTGASNTYSIDSSTAISDNGQTVSTSDIQSGDTVLVTTSGSGSTTATRILVNPSFGGGPGGDSGQTQSAQPPSTSL